MSFLADDESVPTVQCSKCSKWHHQRCVCRFQSTARSFTCPNCRSVGSVETPAQTTNFKDNAVSNRPGIGSSVNADHTTSALAALPGPLRSTSSVRGPRPLTPSIPFFRRSSSRLPVSPPNGATSAPSPTLLNMPSTSGLKRRTSPPLDYTLPSIVTSNISYKQHPVLSLGLPSLLESSSRSLHSDAKGAATEAQKVKDASRELEKWRNTLEKEQQYPSHMTGGSLGTAHLTTNIAANQYISNSRTRANALNQMDPVLPALARLQHMNQDVIAGRSALTPALDPSNPMSPHTSSSSSSSSSLSSLLTPTMNSSPPTERRGQRQPMRKLISSRKLITAAQFQASTMDLLRSFPIPSLTPTMNSSPPTERKGQPQPMRRSIPSKKSIMDLRRPLPIPSSSSLTPSTMNSSPPTERKGQPQPMRKSTPSRKLITAAQFQASTMDLLRSSPISALTTP